MKLLIPIVAAVAMADERDINHKHISTPTVDALPANPINFVNQAFNRRAILSKWKPVNNFGKVQYVDNVEIADNVEIDEKQPIKYYNGAQYNNGYNGYNGFNGYNGYNGYAGFNGYNPNVVQYNTGYNNYRVPYMQNTYNQYKPVEKIVEKIEDIKHHIEDHREEQEHHDDITEKVQMPTYGKLYGKPFFGEREEIKATQGKYSSITGKYYNPYQNNVKVVDNVVKEEYQRPINNGFYNNFNNYVQRPARQVVQQVAAAQPIQYFQQQVQQPIRYVQQQNNQDWFNTFLTYYALSKNNNEEVLVE